VKKERGEDKSLVVAGYIGEIIGGIIIFTIYAPTYPTGKTLFRLSASTVHFVLCSLLSVENVLLAILAVTIPIPGVKHMSVLRPIVLSLVIIGVVLGTIFQIVYNKVFFTPTEESHESDEEEQHESDEEESHEPDEEEPHEPDEEEPREPDEEEPREPDEEEPHEPDEEEPHDS
jgi:hypothetical protein